MRDAASPTHALEGIRSPVLEALLAYVYEGSCEVEEDLLTEMLDASARLVIDPLKEACAGAIQALLETSNALDVWRLAESYTLPALEKAAVTCALSRFEKLPPQSASGAQVLALVQDDWLAAKSEEAVFGWVVRWWEAAERPEAELLAVMKHVRFGLMARHVPPLSSWPVCSKEGQDRLLHHASVASRRPCASEGLPECGSVPCAPERLGAPPPNGPGGPWSWSIHGCDVCSKLPVSLCRCILAKQGQLHVWQRCSRRSARASCVRTHRQRRAAHTPVPPLF